MFSQRSLRPLVTRCCGFEFEDVIGCIDDVSLVAPTHTVLSTGVEAVLDRISRRTPLLARWNPGLRSVRAPEYCELFFAVFQFPSDLFSLNAVRGWRDRCARAICFVEEIWAGEIEQWQGHIELLRSFDHVFVSSVRSVEALQRRIGVPVSYLPAGVDALRFCPAPSWPERAVDVCSIGRRSPITHASLREWARRDGHFYHYDTLADPRAVRDPSEHREMLAALLQRSRYFVANRARTARTRGSVEQQEIGFRFFEGIAGGAVLIGDAPRTPEFTRNFDWPDAVVPLPYHAENAPELIVELDAEPERLQRARSANVRNALLRHDWLHRWARVLGLAGLEPLEAFARRREALEERAALLGEAESALQAAQAI